MRLVLILLLSILVAATTGREASAQKSGARFALVIGNAKYPDNDAPLKDPINDVRDLAKQLKADGFDVDAGENLTKDAMRTALDRLYGKIKSGSVALIFFSGVGIQSNRQSYMIPVDAQLWTEPDVRRDGFSVDAMLAEMNTRGASVKIAILNASRRNPFERRFRPVSAGLAPVIAPRDTMIVYSAAPGVVSNDPNTDRSLFVTEMIKEMRSPGLTADEVFTRTRLNVTRASRGDLTPWYSSSLAEEFSFNQESRRDSRPEPRRQESRREEPLPETRPEPRQESRPSSSDAEGDVRRDYQRAGQIGTRKGWEDFLDKHPTGRYSILAEDQLAKLDSPSSTPKTAARDPEPVRTTPKKEPEKSVVEDDEIRELNRRIERDPKDTTSYYKRGLAFAKNGSFARADKDFNEVIRSNPNDADALNNRCWARAMLDELQMALKDCDEALRIRPRFADALDSRGFVKLKLGMSKNAIADYDASLRINASQASSLYGRGIAKTRSGNTAGGNSDIAEAKSINPRIADEFADYGIR